MTSFCFVNSKQTSIEIEQLNARVVEAETKLKSEVTRIKKKLQIQITELELSLDVANKTNIDLQKVVKKQSLQVSLLSECFTGLDIILKERINYIVPMDQALNKVSQNILSITNITLIILIIFSSSPRSRPTTMRSRGSCR